MSNINNNMQTQTSNTLHNAIMEAGSKDRPSMLAPGNYIQWKSKIKRYIDTKPNHELIHYCLENPPYELGWKEKVVLDSEGNPTTATERMNMNSLTNSNLELKNMFGQFMKMNTASSTGSGTLPSNTITNPKEDLKGITTRSGNAYQGPTIPTTSSSPQVVEHETKVTKDTMPPTNNRSTKDVQPPVV
nr:reverse transcriptase domain-containing protein [Tanacetum cinerariifolium]